MEQVTVNLCASKTICTTKNNKIKVVNSKINPRFLEPITLPEETASDTMRGIFINYGKIFENYDRN